MLEQLGSIKSEKGFTLLTLAMGLGIVAILGGAITIATIQMFRGASYNQVALAPSAGQFKQAGEKIGTARVQIEGNPIRMTTQTVKFAIVSTNGSVTVGGNAQVTSDPSLITRGGIYAAGNVIVSGSASVQADVTATGTISGLEHITGVPRAGYAPGLVFFSDAEITTMVQQYRTEAQAGGTYNGDYSVNNDQNLGPLYINGDIKATKGDITLTGTVYVTGAVNINGQATFSGSGTIVAVGDIDLRGKGTFTPDPGHTPIIFSTNGDITCKGNSGVEKAPGVLYAPRGDIALGGNTSLYGSAMARTVSSTGSSVIYPFAQ